MPVETAMATDSNRAGHSGFPWRIGTENEVRQLTIGRGLDVAVIVAALATLPLYLAPELGLPDPIVHVADWIVWSVFLLEYVLMFCLVSDRVHYVMHRWLNVVVVLLTFPLLPDLMAMAAIIRVTQLTRLTRLFRLVRTVTISGVAMGNLRAVLGRPGLVYMGILTIFLVFGSGALMTVLEPPTVKGSAGEGIWWAIVTASTVGYGDISPNTLGGRIIAVVLMITGIGLISTLSASIAAYFVEQEGAQETTAMLKRIDSLQHGLLQSNERIERLLLLGTNVKSGDKPGQWCPRFRDGADAEFESGMEPKDEDCEKCCAARDACRHYPPPREGGAGPAGGLALGPQEGGQRVQQAESPAIPLPGAVL